jgi:hypothetical protein
MKGQKIDWDLDVYLALQDFPDDSEHDGYIYIRTEANMEKFETKSALGFVGRFDILSMAMHHLMLKEEGFAHILLDATFNYLVNTGGDEKQMFIRELKHAEREDNGEVSE